MGSAGELLSASIVFGRNLRRNTVNIRGVDVLNVQVVELAVLGLANLDDRQGANFILAIHAHRDLGSLDALLDQHLITVLKGLGDGSGQLRGLMDQGDAIARTVDGGLHKAALATNLDDTIDIDLISRLKRQAGGNGDARLGVQELRDLFIGTTGAREHARSRVGDTQGLHGPLHGAILAAGAVHGDKRHVKTTGRHGHHKVIGSRIEQLHRGVAGLLQCHDDVLSRIERNLTLGGMAARQDRYVHVL